MPRDTHSPSRQELLDQTDRNADEMRDKELDLEVIKEDLERIRSLWGELDLDGFTFDGNEDVQRSVEGSENVAEEVFDERDKTLDEAQEKNEEFSRELNDREETSEKNLGKISDHTASLQTRDVIDAVREVKEANLRDIEALREIIDRAREAKEQSDRRQDDLRRVREG